MAITWTIDTSVPFSEAVCGAATENAPTAVDGTEGLSLAKLQGITVTAQAASAFTAGTKLHCYIVNAKADTPAWYRAAELDLTMTADTKVAWPAFEVLVQDGYIAWVPSAVGQAPTIYMVGSKKQP